MQKLTDILANGTSDSLRKQWRETEAAGDFEPFHLQVLDIRDGKVAHVGAFFDPSLFATFGLPARLPSGYRPGDPVPADAEVARGDHAPLGHESVADPR